MKYMSRASSSFGAIAVLASAVAHVASTVMAQSGEVGPIVVEDPIPISMTDQSTRPIVGFRATSSSFVDSKFVDTPAGWNTTALYLPESVIVKAWLSDQKFANAVKLKGVSEITIDSLRASGIDVEKFDWMPIGEDYKSIRPLKLPEDGFMTGVGGVDSSAIIGMTAKSMLDLSHTYEIVMGNSKDSAVAVDPKYAENLLYTYQGSKNYGNYKLSDPAIAWETPQDLLKDASLKFPFGVEKIITVQLGSASFGKLRLQSASEAGFKVEKRLSRKYDIYLIEIATTLHNLPDEGIEEVSVRIDCSENCVAWELAPFRVGIEVETTDTLKTPEITFKDITVGEFFSRTVVYKTLRPQIIAFGLREDQFSWSLKEGAIGMGSHVFFAAIGVPKGSKDLNIKRSVALRTADGILIEGKWAVTENVLETVELRQ